MRSRDDKKPITATGVTGYIIYESLQMVRSTSKIDILKLFNLLEDFKNSQELSSYLIENAPMLFKEDYIKMLALLFMAYFLDEEAQLEPDVFNEGDI